MIRHALKLMGSFQVLGNQLHCGQSRKGILSMDAYREAAKFGNNPRYAKDPKGEKRPIDAIMIAKIATGEIDEGRPETSQIAGPATAQVSFL
jgi:hypothetical protein